MSTQVESSGAGVVSEEPSNTAPGRELESLRVWSNTLALLGVVAALGLAGVHVSDGMRGSAWPIWLAVAIALHLRVIAVFAVALQRIERRLHGLPPGG